MRLSLTHDAAILAQDKTHMAAFEKCIWTMGSGDIEVWTARPLELAAQTVDMLQEWLDSSELARAARFRLPADRRSYTVAHALQRWLLGRALGCEPAAVQLAQGKSGKPVLLNPRAGPRPFFNLSHTREAVACAVSHNHPVGLDLESLRPVGGVDSSLLEPFIAQLPLHLEATQDVAARSRQLLLLWTALEAYWKAHGDGLAVGRPRLAVRRTPDAVLEIRHEGDAATDKPRARARASDQVSGHMLCVAVPCSLSYRETGAVSHA